MPKKYRILLYAMTLKRDIGAFHVLARILEKFGHQVYVAGTNNYASRTMQLWKPHAVVYPTIGRTLPLRKIYPHSKLFYFTGEGGESFTYSEEKLLAEDENLFDAISQAYLWGKMGKDHIFKNINILKEKSFLYGKENLLDDKITISGHPRLDLIRFSLPNKKDNEKINIGLIGQFNAINNPYKDSILKKGFNNASIEPIVYQSSLLYLYIRLVKKLDPGRYTINIRPYPLENMEQYHQTQWVRDGVLQVDNSFDFCTWMMKQDLIIGPTSSTISQLALAKIPYINTDIVANFPEEDYRDSIRELFFKYLPHNAPKNFDELISMIDNHKELSNIQPEFFDVMHYIYNTNDQESCILNTAKDISNRLNGFNLPFGHSIPLPIIERIFTARYKKNIKSYSDFLYKNLKSDLEDEFNAVIDNILAQRN